MCDKCDRLQRAIARHVDAVRAADKTPDYTYSNTKTGKNRQGEHPGPGKRWLTPRELADVLRIDAELIKKESAT